MNPLELKVLKVMAVVAINSTDGAFGCSDEVKVAGLTGKQLGGYMSVLEKKDLLKLHPIRVNGGTKVVQYVLSEEGWKAAGHPEFTNR